jgi:hypothetical protein
MLLQKGVVCNNLDIYVFITVGTHCELENIAYLNKDNGHLIVAGITHLYIVCNFNMLLKAQ